MIKDVHSPHDRFFTATFKNKETAARFIEAYIPRQAVELLDLSQLEVDNTHFVDEALQQYRSDLLYQVPFKNGKPAYVYILFEHQSTPDASMPFRMLQYMVKVWEYTRLKHDTKRLLPILPLVMSQCTWPYSPALLDMMDLDEEDRKVFGPWVPDFNHLLLDLSTVDTEQIQGTVYGKIALHLLKSSQKGRIVEAYQRVEPLLKALLQQDNAMGFIETLLRYSAQVAEDVSTINELRELVVTTIDEAAGETLMTIAEQIEREVADKYEQQLAEMARKMAKQKQETEKEKELALQEKEVLLKQLRDAGIDPKTQH